MAEREQQDNTDSDKRRSLVWVDGRHIDVKRTVSPDERASGDPPPPEVGGGVAEWIDLRNSVVAQSQEWFESPLTPTRNPYAVWYLGSSAAHRREFDLAGIQRAVLGFPLEPRWAEPLTSKILRLHISHSRSGKQGVIVFTEQEPAVQIGDLALSAINRVDEMLGDFGDLGKRLGLMIEIKKILRDSWILARQEGDKYAKQIAVMLHESLRNAHAEQMTVESVSAVRNILAMLIEKSVTLNDARTAQRILLSVGLDYVPSVESDDSSTS